MPIENESGPISVYRAFILSEWRHYCESELGVSWTEPTERLAEDFAEYVARENTAMLGGYEEEEVRILERAAARSLWANGNPMEPLTLWTEELTDYIDENGAVRALKAPMDASVAFHAEEGWIAFHEDVLLEEGRGDSPSEALADYRKILGKAFLDSRAFACEEEKARTAKYDPKAGSG